MKNADKWILKIFVYALPVIIALAIFDHFYKYPPTPDGSSFLMTIHDFSGLAFSAWILLTLFLSLRLLLSQEFRDEVLGRLTFFKDRDEREVFLSGQATRYAFMSSLAILGLLLCLSVFQVSVYRVPPERAVNGKTGTLSLDADVRLLKASDSNVASEASVMYFAHSGLPLTNTAVILLLIIWQIGSYNLFMKKKIE
jgi:hypothetical protein